MAKVPTAVATNAPCNALSQSEGFTCSSCIKMSGAGMFPELSSFAVAIALSLSNPPEI